MSKIAPDQPIDDIAEKLPKYCNFFEHLLVEELVLEPDYRRLHYGKCAVIGRLSAVPDYFKLENVPIPHLPREYTLPTGAVSVLLLNFTYNKSIVKNLADKSYCIVRGEVVLCNVQKPNCSTLSIRGLHEQLLRLADNEEDRLKFLKEVEQTHKPAISVWHANAIDQAEQLIQRRLEMRMLIKDKTINDT